MDLPMAAADALFLWAETPTRPLHVGALAVLSQPDNGTGRYLRKVFSAAVARQQVAPWWRRRPHRSLTSLGQWSWRTETEVDLDYHVRLSALPPRAGTAELWALVSELHAGMLDRSRPLWQVDLIEGLPGGRCAVYVKVHHALADGVSVMRLLQRIVTADPHQRQMPTLWEVPAQASVAKHTAPRGSSRPLTLAKGCWVKPGRPGHGARSGRYHVAGSAMSQRAADTGRTTHPAERADRRGPVRGRLFLSDRAAATGRRTRRCHHQRCRAGHVRRGVTCVPDQPGSVTGCAADSDGAGFAARYRSYRRVRPGSRQQDRYVDVFAGDAPGQSGRTAVGDTGKYARRQSRDRRPKPKPGAGYERIGRRPLALRWPWGACPRRCAHQM